MAYSHQKASIAELRFFKREASSAKRARRASVTVAAGILQKAGLITYKRGAVKVESRPGLEDATCECYGIMTEQIKKWQAEAN